ncbi:fimbria/pilus periplasmic chaperone [Rouxiella chamberiensis]|uniref:Fimbria/pilus periplasmic chaperone n=1 Tax=Rouxiella chamberiensis TaxID=1513468 RepID=A0ABY7HPC4_9GAMM|nr:fimbria/pilus periplasmic chaperone [Rouxiella chamberiensis]WAT00746.1 fimbria/pilus periplasmic chaperone [Rouxiella chamberiensis]
MLSKYGNTPLPFIFLVIAAITPQRAQAEGGLSIQGTRIIYPQGARQVSVSLTNSSSTDSYLVQSRIEDAQGNKTTDFIVTPPLYLSGPKNENVVRVMYMGGALPTDRESLYYFVEKAIPSLDKTKIQEGNVLLLATANRIKLFVRPQGLTQDINTAAQDLQFTQSGQLLHISNPSPYYVTLTDIQYGIHNIDTLMIAPKSQLSQTVSEKSVNRVSYHAINDFGGTSNLINKTVSQ